MWEALGFSLVSELSTFLSSSLDNRSVGILATSRSSHSLRSYIYPFARVMSRCWRHVCVAYLEHYEG
jgi:hypothetical protein